MVDKGFAYRADNSIVMSARARVAGFPAPLAFDPAKGTVSGDIVSATQAYASKDVLGTNGSTLQVSSGYTVTDATGANMLGNYMIDASKTATGTITPATLTITTQEQAGFQLMIARMDPELLRLWDAPSDAPYFVKR